MVTKNYEFMLKSNGTYFKEDCCICGNERLCYIIIEKKGIKNKRDYICRNCKDKFVVKIQN